MKQHAGAGGSDYIKSGIKAPREFGAPMNIGVSTYNDGAGLLTFGVLGMHNDIHLTNEALYELAAEILKHKAHWSAQKETTDAR